MKRDFISRLMVDMGMLHTGQRPGGEHLQRVVLCGSTPICSLLCLQGCPAVAHQLPQNGGAAPRGRRAG